MTLFINILPMTLDPRPGADGPEPGGPELNLMVVAVAYDRLCAFELGVATELFGLARPELGIEWYDFRVASADRGPLRTLGGLMVSASHDLSILPTAGTIVLPGWRDPAEEPPDDLLDGILAAHDLSVRGRRTTDLHRRRHRVLPRQSAPR
jgi:transcriptional regulator GlxA family with amidase domain